MKRAISLSALVSGLLAVPCFAVPPTPRNPNTGIVVVTGETAVTPADIAKLQQILDEGPGDVGGMQKLQKDMADKVQAQLGTLLAQAKVQPAAPQEIQFGQFQGGAQVAPRMEKATFLGVTTSPASPTLREQLGIPKGMGLVVDFVAKDSPAENAGLKVHDVMQKLDDQLLVNAEQLAVLVRAKKPGDAITLTVIRAGKPTEIKAALVEKELPPLPDRIENFSAPRLIIPGVQGNSFDLKATPERAALPEGWQKTLQSRVVANGDGSRTATITDPNGTYTLTRDKDGKTTATATDKNGKETWSGPFTTEEDQKKAPPDVAEKLKNIKLDAGANVIELTRPQIYTGATTVINGGVVSRIDDQHTILLYSTDKGKQLKVVEKKSDKVLYEGPRTEEALKSLPEEIRTKVTEFQKQWPKL